MRKYLLPVLFGFMVSCQGITSKEVIKGFVGAFNVLGCTTEMITSGMPLLMKGITADGADWQAKVMSSIGTSATVAKGVACAAYAVASMQAQDASDTAESNGYRVWNRASICDSRGTYTNKPDGKCGKMHNRAAYMLIYVLKVNVSTGNG